MTGRKLLLISNVLAVLAGSLIPLQGVANRSLGEQIGSYLLAGFASLLGSVIILLLFMPVWHFLFGRTIGLVRLWRMRQEFGWRFWVTGTAGAIYIALLAAALSIISLAAAIICTLIGLVLFGLVVAWRSLGLWNRLLAIAGVLLAMLGTVCVALAVYGVEGTFSLLSLIYELGLIGAGASIGWQFLMLGRLMSASSAPLAAAFVSSVTGMFSAAILVVGYALVTQDQPLPPAGAWPTQPYDLWMYGGAVAGVGIIPIAAIVTPRLGPRRYTLNVNAGNLLAGYLLGLPDMLASSSALLLGALGCLLAFAGVFLTKLERKEKQDQPSRVQQVPVANS